MWIDMKPNPDKERGGAFSIDGFAQAHGISRSQTYVEIGQGRLIARKVGVRTVITAEDAAAWRRNLPRYEISPARPP